MPGMSGGGRCSVEIGTGSSNSWRGSGEDVGLGVLMCVGYSDAVTSVARDTILGVWMISSSGT